MQQETRVEQEPPQPPQQQRQALASQICWEAVAPELEAAPPEVAVAQVAVAQVAVAQVAVAQATSGGSAGARAGVKRQVVELSSGEEEEQEAQEEEGGAPSQHPSVSKQPCIEQPDGGEPEGAEHLRSRELQEAGMGYKMSLSRLDGRTGSLAVRAGRLVQLNEIPRLAARGEASVRPTATLT